EVRLRDELVERDELDARRQLLGRERIEADDVHAQAHAARRRVAADVAEADDAQRLAGDLDAHELLLLPLTALHAGVGAWDLAGEREHEADGQLGRRGRVALRRVDDEDALRRGRLDVDVVDADAGAADDLQVARIGQGLGLDLRGRANAQAVVLT